MIVPSGHAPRIHSGEPFCRDPGLRQSRFRLRAPVFPPPEVDPKSQWKRAVKVHARKLAPNQAARKRKSPPQKKSFFRFSVIFFLQVEPIWVNFSPSQE